MKKPKIATSFFNPFFIVIFLTIICIFLSVKNLNSLENSAIQNFYSTLQFWRQGFFSLTGFTLQMMMILVFGYCLAVYKPFYTFLRKVAAYPRTATQGVLFVGTLTMLAGLMNWGFGLIAGALLARFVSISFQEKNVAHQPAILASAGYLGMAVWHGGISGSAPLKVAEADHFLADSIGVISLNQTIFSLFNLTVTLGLCLVFLITLYLLARQPKSGTESVKARPLQAIGSGMGFPIARYVGIAMLLLVITELFRSGSAAIAGIDLNLVNFTLFGLVLVAYRTLDRFTESVGEGIKTSVDIFIQFPFYAGILGILTESGLLNTFSNQVVAWSGVDSLAPFTLASAALVNFLVPSGGGQWAVQGPVLMEAAMTLGLDPGRMVMAFSYGDQISNLLQPFWALPLLAITGVSARAIFKFTFWLFLAGFSYLLALMFFIF
ncbi:TIGR00366 family protein [Algoriphagus namhaensis]